MFCIYNTYPQETLPKFYKNTTSDFDIKCSKWIKQVTKQVSLTSRNNLVNINGLTMRFCLCHTLISQQNIFTFTILSLLTVVYSILLCRACRSHDTVIQTSYFQCISPYNKPVWLQQHLIIAWRLSFCCTNHFVEEIHQEKLCFSKCI